MIVYVVSEVVSIVFDSQTNGRSRVPKKKGPAGLAKRDEVLIAYHSASNLLSLAKLFSLVSFTPLGPGGET